MSFLAAPAATINKLKAEADLEYRDKETRTCGITRRKGELGPVWANNCANLNRLRLAEKIAVDLRPKLICYLQNKTADRVIPIGGLIGDAR